MGSGGKGTSTTLTGQNQNQSYSANPAIQASANQALSGAQTAAATPFSQPVAPVAGLNATQNQAFNQIGALQGSAQPYYNQAQGLYNQASQTPNVASFYNPMAANVTAQLQNIFGEQNQQNTGNLVQSAGGIGADRVAVGQADMANQQGLAAGQTYANLYQQATSAAQAQQQAEMGAASGISGLGTASLNAGLQGTSALLGAGNQQQQQTQAQLNAPYQNTLAQLAYQFQTPQYLAGITGGLAPALGGTTTGQQYTNAQTTPAQPSWLSQLLGAGTAGAGLYGALGGGGQSAAYGGGNAFTDAYGGSSANPLPGLTADDYGTGFAGGGKVKFTGGGSVWPVVEGFDDGGQTAEQTDIPGGASGVDPVVPYMPLKAGAGHSGPLTGGMTFAQPSAPAQSGSGSSAGSDIGTAIGTAAKILPLFLKSGGKIKGYDSGGDIDSWDNTALQAGADMPWTLGDRFNAAFPQMGTSADTNEINPTPVPAGTIPLPRPSPIDAPGSHPDAFRLEPGVKAKDDDDDDEDTPAVTAPANVPSTPNQIRAAMMPTAQQPYPDALQRDWGQQAARSPWLALVQAGATMMSTPGPLGTAIGKGLMAGTKSVEDQRKELRSEQELNDKAQQLYEAASDHLDKYNQMTPYERGSLAARNKEIDQGVSSGEKALHARALQYFKMLKGDVNNMSKSDPEILQQAYRLARGQMGGVATTATSPAVGPGSSAASALPDPGQAARQPGKWYIGPTGQPQQWIGQ